VKSSLTLHAFNFIQNIFFLFCSGVLKNIKIQFYNVERNDRQEEDKKVIDAAQFLLETAIRQTADGALKSPLFSPPTTCTHHRNPLHRTLIGLSSIFRRHKGIIFVTFKKI
jgi:hypothetical protein